MRLLRRQTMVAKVWHNERNPCCFHATVAPSDIGGKSLMELLRPLEFLPDG